MPKQIASVKPPKNESSRRLLAIPVVVMAMLEEHRRQQDELRRELGPKWNQCEHPKDFVFTQRNGKAMFPGTMSKWFPDFLARHKLPHLNFHGLRHTCASLLIAEGATPTDLSKRLGHSTANTTLAVYAHSFKKADEKLADKMASILQNVTVEKK